VRDLSEAGAIVFGGASGLGAAAAKRLTGAGAEVVVADLAAEVPTDVTDPEAVAAAVERAAGAPRGLRVAVVCAGVATPAKLLGREGATPLDRFAGVIGVNLTGTINALRLAAAAMTANEPQENGERGVCVLTASIAAYDGQVGQIAYAASKGGVVGLTLPAARELARHGVRVVTIAPGLFDTALLAGLPAEARASLAGTVPFPERLGDPAEYGDLVGQVVSNQMLNGVVIRLDGALRMAPR